jgi:hypothetical protein
MPTLDETGKLMAVSTTESHLTQPSAHLTGFNLFLLKYLVSRAHFSIRFIDRNSLNLYTTVFWGSGVLIGNLLSTFHRNLPEPSSRQSEYFAYSILLWICACSPPHLMFLDLVNIKVICEK